MGGALTSRPPAAPRRILATAAWPVRRLLYPQFAWVRAMVADVDRNAETRTRALEERIVARIDALQVRIDALQARLADLETSVVESLTLASGELRATGDAIASLERHPTTVADSSLTAVAAYAGRALAGLRPGDRVAVGGAVADEIAGALVALGLEPAAGDAAGCSGAILALSGLGSEPAAGVPAVLRRLRAAIRPGGVVVIVAAETTPTAMARALGGWDISDLSTVDETALVLATVCATAEVARA